MLRITMSNTMSSPLKLSVCTDLAVSLNGMSVVSPLTTVSESSTSFCSLNELGLVSSSPLDSIAMLSMSILAVPLQNLLSASLRVSNTVVVRPSVMNLPSLSLLRMNDGFSVEPLMLRMSADMDQSAFMPPQVIASVPCVRLNSGEVSLWLESLPQPKLLTTSMIGRPLSAASSSLLVSALAESIRTWVTIFAALPAGRGPWVIW